jgi:NAD-dependent DNA ligase
MAQSQSQSPDTYISDKILNKILANPVEYGNNLSIKKLANLLRILSNVYHNTNSPIVSDQIYDILYDILKDRDPNNSFLTEVGSAIQVSGTKAIVKLPYAMASLNKIRPNKENLSDWTDKYMNAYVLSDKLDGVSAQLYHETLNNFRLYTRGNGQEGQDISHLINILFDKKSLEKIPLKTSIRGEIIISKQDFDKISKEMKNARNAVSGIVNAKKPNMKIAKLCQFVGYSILYPVYTPEKQLSLLESYNIKTVNYKILDYISYPILREYLITRKKDSEFEIDGIVVYDNGEPDSNQDLSIVSNPENAFAFKTMLADQIIEAKIIQVLWEASKDGYLKPRIQIEPIELSGTTITYATAFNAKYVLDNKLGSGAIIKITRSGDVIPYIVEVVRGANQAQMPDEKKIPYRWTDTKIDIVMLDLNTEDIQVKIIYNFFNTIGVEYFGEKIVGKIYDDGYTSIKDILTVFIKSRSKLYTIDGLGEIIIDKIHTNIILAFKNLDLLTLMCASHVFGRGLGRKKLLEIVRDIPDIMLVKWTSDKLFDRVLDIKGFSDKTASQFSDNFHLFKAFYKDINKIIDISHIIELESESESERDSDSSPEVSSDAEPEPDFSGKIFVFTGFRDKELEKKVEKLGGKITSSVSSKTDAVICADLSAKTSKILDAEKKKIKILTREQFLDKYRL